MLEGHDDLVRYIGCVCVCVYTLYTFLYKPDNFVYIFLLGVSDLTTRGLSVEHMMGR